MAHNIKAKYLKYDYALYARLKSTVFGSRLKALWLVISWIDMGSEFHAAGPANTKLHSPTWDELQVVHSVDCSQNEVGNAIRCWRSTWLVQTDIYDGLHLVWMRCLIGCLHYSAGITNMFDEHAFETRTSHTFVEHVHHTGITNMYGRSLWVGLMSRIWCHWWHHSHTIFASKCLTIITRCF